MYAVVAIKGFQYKLEKGDVLRVPKYDIEVGKKIKIDEVLLLADGDSFSIGQPYVDGAVVEATVTGQGKYDKIVVFKKKRRKDYSVKRGHRQDFTEISVNAIKVTKSKSKKDEKAEAQPEEAIEEKAPKVEAAAAKPEADKKAEKKEKKSSKKETAPEKDTASDTEAEA